MPKSVGWCSAPTAPENRRCWLPWRGVFPIGCGTVSLQGKPLAQWRPEALADWRAWCPQFWSDPFPSTVAETAAIAVRRGAWWNADRDDDEAVARGLDELDLASLADADVRQLSGGERQRLSTARRRTWALCLQTALNLLHLAEVLVERHRHRHQPIRRTRFPQGPGRGVLV